MLSLLNSHTSKESSGYPILPNPAFGKTDSLMVTSVYEVVRKCQPAVIAGTMHPIDGCHGSEIIRRRSIRKMARFVETLLLVTPDLKHSAEAPVNPFRADSLEQFSGHSWPVALGSRVLMPPESDSPQWNMRCAFLLSHLYNRQL